MFLDLTSTYSNSARLSTSKSLFLRRPKNHAIPIERIYRTIIGAAKSIMFGISAVGETTAAANPDDEIGDLQRAFGRMARTIGQREAVLRAQNQALGALNRRVAQAKGAIVAPA